MHSHSTLPRLLLLALLLGVGTTHAQEVERVPPIPPGEPFRVGSFANLNAEGTGADTVELGEYVGKKAFVLYYWIAGNRRSEEVFRELQGLFESLPTDKIALLGAAVPRPGLGPEAIRERIAALGIRVPVIEDTGFVIGQSLQISSVPNITIVDASGRLQLSNGASLRQVLGYRLDLEKAIRQTAATGKLMTHGYLPRYFPVNELAGEMCPDFTAPQLADSVERRWYDLLDDQKVNVLIFWSVDCPHCRKSLPEINAWLAEHPEGLNVVSCASTGSDEVKTKTAEFCELNGFRFPTLVDNDSHIGDLYKVTTTPTIVIIRPDGVVDSAIVSGHADFGRTIEEKKRSLLGSSG